jgi:hypothetical protein
MSTNTSNNNDDGLGLPVRMALILLLALMVGGIVTGLSCVGGIHWAIALIAGGCAIGGSAVFFHWLIKK